MERFTGTVQYIGSAAQQALTDWITAIPFEEWPQQTPIDSGLRPAMVKDLEWHGFGGRVSLYIQDVMQRHIGAGTVSNILLTVVMPGHDIPEHVDTQPEHWRARVHAPLTTNEESRFYVGGEHHHMDVGGVYLVNTTVPHAVKNDGATPRIHLMWDVLA